MNAGKAGNMLRYVKVMERARLEIKLTEQKFNDQIRNKPEVRNKLLNSNGISQVAAQDRMRY